MRKNNILNYELKRLGYNKLLLWLSISVIALLFILITASYFVQDSVPSEKGQPLYNKESKLEYYEQTIQKNNQLLLSSDFNESEKNAIIKQNKEYAFYIEHDITEYDCLDISEPYLKIDGYENVGFSFYFMKSVYYFLLAFAVLIALYVFAFDYSHTRIKNILAAPIKRKSVFLQKVLFCGVIITTVCILFFVYALAFCLNGAKNYFLSYRNGQYYLFNCIYALIGQFIGLFVLMAVFAIIVAIVAVFSRNVAVSATMPLVLYGIIYIVFILLQKQFDIEQNIDKIIDALKWMPFINIQQYWQYGFDLSYFIILAIHFVFAVSLCIIAKFKFIRQDL